MIVAPGTAAAQAARKDGLVGEALEEGDLAVGEWVDFAASHTDHTERRAFPQQGHAQLGPMFATLRQSVAYWELVSGGAEVGHMDCSSFEHRAAANCSSHYRDHELTDRTGR